MQRQLYTCSCKNGNHSLRLQHLRCSDRTASRFGNCKFATRFAAVKDTRGVKPKVRSFSAANTARQVCLYKVVSDALQLLPIFTTATPLVAAKLVLPSRFIPLATRTARQVCLCKVVFAVIQLIFEAANTCHCKVCKAVLSTKLFLLPYNSTASRVCRCKCKLVTAKRTYYTSASTNLHVQTFTLQRHISAALPLEFWHLRQR